MLKVENNEVFGFEHAIRGMRNPMNSWDKSDSEWVDPNQEFVTYELDDGVLVERISLDEGFDPESNEFYAIGDNDLKLMQNLYKAGTDHRKFMRMIVVFVDIIAPLYWWKEFDTYKVGTVVNSCSTMHKIQAKEFVREDFSHEHMNVYSLNILATTIERLNSFRNVYLHGGMSYDENHKYVLFEPKSKYIWWQMIQLLPTSYNQRRTVLMNYEVLANIYNARKNHKLDEWHRLCEFACDLPYFCDIIGIDGYTEEG